MTMEKTILEIVDQHSGGIKFTELMCETLHPNKRSSSWMSCGRMDFDNNLDIKQELWAFYERSQDPDMPLEAIPTKESEEMLTRDGALQIGRNYIEANRSKIVKAAIVGSILRNHPECKDVDVVAVVKGESLPAAPFINLFTIPEESWETAILHWAPGRAIIQIKIKAKAKGYTLNQYGLFKDNEVVSRKVDEICKILGIEMPEPVKRSLAGELTWKG